MHAAARVFYVVVQRLFSLFSGAAPMSWLPGRDAVIAEVVSCRCRVEPERERGVVCGPMLCFKPLFPVSWQGSVVLLDDCCWLFLQDRKRCGRSLCNTCSGALIVVCPRRGDSCRSQDVKKKKNGCPVPAP